MDNNLGPILALEDDDERATALRQLAEAINSGSASALVERDVATLAEEVEVGAHRLEPTDWCFVTMWRLLWTVRDRPQVLEMARRILADREARCRYMAFTYIHLNSPEQAERLFHQYETDSDPELLGRVDNQVSQNSRAATCRNPRKFTAVFS
jgi:hypothetical protein